MRRMLLILALLFASTIVDGVSGQGNDDESEITLLVDFGFAGKAPTGKNTPARVLVQAGRDHISGFVELEYVSNQGVSGRVISPMEAAAGSNVVVPMVVPMPEWCTRVTLTLRAQGGRTARTVYELQPGPGSIQLRPGLQADQELLLSLTNRVAAGVLAQRFVRSTISGVDGTKGDDSNEDLVLVTPWVRSSETNAFSVMSRAFGVNAINSELPISAAAYEGVFAAIVDETSLKDMDTRAVLAIQQWVLGGGRLVVLADRPGMGWQRFIPPGAPTDVIDIGASSEIETPASLASQVDRRLFPKLTGRVKSLGLLGEECGWRERWACDGGSLVVEGPVGLGWVTIVSVQPEDVGAGEDSWHLWADVLQPAMDAVVAHEHEPRTLHNMPAWGYQRELGRSLPGQVFDSIGEATAIGSAAIALVALVTISLAVALGPIDFFLLKAIKMRHLAWLSALVWIALASGIAVIAPSKLRAGPSTASRFVVVDAVVRNEALDTRHPGQRMIDALPIEVRSSVLGMTHFFAGSSDRFTVDAGGVWFEYSSAMRETMLTRPTTMRQSPVSGGIEAMRGSTPVGIEPGIWSVKTFIDQGLRPCELGVRLGRVERGWELSVSGLGADARIVSGQIRVGAITSRLGGRYLVRQSEDPATVVFETDMVRNRPERMWSDPFIVDPQRPYMKPWMRAERLEDLMPSALLALPGVFEHDLAIEAYLASGRFAVVYLFVVEQSIDIGIEPDDAMTKRSSVYRLVVPIEMDEVTKEPQDD
ncbi:MAG: hypothetical protein H6808_09790 [Phycisphaera sp.]|nr:hypothetical protein [Phycisphaera sp.]